MASNSHYINWRNVFGASQTEGCGALGFRKEIMRSSSLQGGRLIAAGVLFCLIFPWAGAAAAVPQQGAEARSAEALPTLPDPLPAQSGAAQAGSGQTPSGDQNPGNRPVGTAAAPLEKSTGIAGSRPAGAVIAPAKQKRERAILIRVGILVGAAIAVGAVVGLSEASRSRP